ncbi:hypothetical protein Tco_0636462, partial [Tanacetum coccineum]
MLKEQAVDRSNSLQIVRRHAQVKRDVPVAEHAQIKIAFRRRRIDIG